MFRNFSISLSELTEFKDRNENEELSARDCQSRTRASYLTNDTDELESRRVLRIMYEWDGRHIDAC